jgi:PKHD-type hydroxylase
MLLHVPQVMAPDTLAALHARLADAPWTDGRATAGPQAALAKRNQQLPESWPGLATLQRPVLDALARHPLFFSAALPRQVSPPMFNRHGGAGNHFGPHVDSAVRHLPGGGMVRSDIACTLFLSDPAAYDGGALAIDDTFGRQRVRLPAGDLVLYPAHSVHQVEPVTRGVRVACFFWVQSMVRCDTQRRLLFDMDRHLTALRSRGAVQAQVPAGMATGMPGGLPTGAHTGTPTGLPSGTPAPMHAGDDDPAVIGLTGTYHNLLRLWIET